VGFTSRVKAEGSSQQRTPTTTAARPTPNNKQTNEHTSTHMHTYAHTHTRVLLTRARTNTTRIHTHNNTYTHVRATPTTTHTNTHAHATTINTCCHCTSPLRSTQFYSSLCALALPVTYLLYSVNTRATHRRRTHAHKHTKSTRNNKLNAPHTLRRCSLQAGNKNKGKGVQFSSQQAYGNQTQSVRSANSGLTTSDDLFTGSISVMRMLS
jgi:hypothetical protein